MKLDFIVKTNEGNDRRILVSAYAVSNIVDYLLECGIEKITISKHGSFMEILFSQDEYELCEQKTNKRIINQIIPIKP